MNMVKEAEVIMKIAKTLDKFSEEKACVIMAEACLAIGEYDYAIAFAQMAKIHQQRSNHER